MEVGKGIEDKLAIVGVVSTRVLSQPEHAKGGAHGKVLDVRKLSVMNMIQLYQSQSSSVIIFSISVDQY